MIHNISILDRACAHLPETKKAELNQATASSYNVLDKLKSFLSILMNVGTSDPVAELKNLAISFHKIMAELEAYLAEIDGGGKVPSGELMTLLEGMHQCANVLRSLMGQIPKTSPLYKDCSLILADCAEISNDIGSGDMGSPEALDLCTQVANLLTAIINS